MKALFLGLGGVGQRHLRNLRQIDPSVELIAVRKRARSFEICADLSVDESVDITEKYGIRCFKSLSDALADKPDYAIVSNPTSLHVETARALVEAGVPVFLEKPISANDEGLDELALLSKEKNVPVMIGYMMRFHPCALHLQKLLADQALGPVHSATLISHSYVPGWHSYEKPKDFYAGSKALGGGAVLTEIHEVDLLHWYFGPAKRVFGLGGKLSAIDMDVEDCASALLEFEQNGRRIAATVNVSFAQPSPTRQFLVFCERGRIAWDLMRQRIEIDDAIEKKSDVFEVPDFQRNDLFVRELEHFLECLKEGSTPTTDLSLVLDGHRTALKVLSDVDGGNR